MILHKKFEIAFSAKYFKITWKFIFWQIVYYYVMFLKILEVIACNCYIVGLGLNCKFIDLLFKRSFNIFIKISLYLNFIVLEIVSKQTDTLIQELMYLR